MTHIAQQQTVSHFCCEPYFKIKHKRSIFSDFVYKGTLQISWLAAYEVMHDGLV